MDVNERCSTCRFLQEFDEKCGLLRIDHQYITDTKCEDAKKRHAEGVHLAKLRKVDERMNGVVEGTKTSTELQRG